MSSAEAAIADSIRYNLYHQSPECAESGHNPFDNPCSTCTYHENLAKRHTKPSSDPFNHSAAISNIVEEIQSSIDTIQSQLYILSAIDMENQL